MKLLIFTQKVDSEDPILGFFCEWINEFSLNVERVSVICLKEGKHDFPKNVTVYSLGKERNVGRIVYIVNLFKYLYTLNKSYDTVFVHMNPVYLCLCGLWWKIKKIPAYLWYVHKHVDLKLRIAVLFSEKVFTSSKDSMNVGTSKVTYVGHGIDVNRFLYTSHNYEGNELRIGHVGRLSRIKGIDLLINTIVELRKQNSKASLHLFGDFLTPADQIYKQEIINLIKKEKIDDSIFFRGWVLPKEIPSVLKDMHITINLAPTGGVDKSVLESILLGLPVFTANKSFEDIFGEYAYLFMYRYSDVSDLVLKISKYLKTQRTQGILDSLNKNVREQFSLKKLVVKLLNNMTNTI